MLHEPFVHDEDHASGLAAVREGTTVSGDQLRNRFRLFKVLDIGEIASVCASHECGRYDADQIGHFSRALERVGVSGVRKLHIHGDALNFVVDVLERCAGVEYLIVTEFAKDGLAGGADCAVGCQPDCGVVVARRCALLHERILDIIVHVEPVALGGGVDCGGDERAEIHFAVYDLLRVHDTPLDGVAFLRPFLEVQRGRVRIRGRDLCHCVRVDRLRFDGGETNLFEDCPVFGNATFQIGVFGCDSCAVETGFGDFESEIHHAFGGEVRQLFAGERVCNDCHVIPPFSISIIF